MPRGHAPRTPNHARLDAPGTARRPARPLLAAWLAAALLLPVGLPQGMPDLPAGTLAAFLPTVKEARADEPASYQPGFRTMGIWIPETGERLDVAVWYPSVRAPSEIHLGDWTLDVARGGKEVPGRFPLLVISHCTAGSRLAHHDTAEALARAGFVVAAPTHPGDNSNDTSSLFLPEQLTARPRHVSTTISRLLRTPETAPMIDPARIGVIGFGTGGATALLLAGARPDGTRYASYCERTTPGDPYCTKWASERLARLPDTLRPLQPGATDVDLPTAPTGSHATQGASGSPASPPPQTTMADARVRAVALVAPGYGMLFPRASLSGVTVPVAILKADDDEVNRAPLHADALRAALPRPPEFSVLAGADHYALMAACPPTLQRDLPELCGGVDEDTRQSIHRTLNARLVRFFLSTLGEAGPPLPAPLPEPEPQVQQAPPPAVNATAPKSKAKSDRDEKRKKDGKPRKQDESAPR
ncbi:dienelactone hydrolase family protein [Nitratidesulfovibrio liaohensis]|uniref:Dienelactone hydrolase family protein n=1 Tax=Nitratidesulfovibrio liaohensis TaxID=2604158 RepID=A0ABY9R4P8_9BACT|nr:dienelactone hydrolase family protein [Nitratidesulfovibrio liaohensis]WMW66730.1 dienelactone hydrolase family protein [Nitratidesulfovibrio liaohensis]